MRARLFELFLLGAAVAGCASRPRASEVAAPIAVRPGVAERIALMDRYRLNDDVRKRMMARPHVWVEEVTEEELDVAPPAAEGTTDASSMARAGTE